MVGVDGHVLVKYGSTYTACPGFDVQIVDDDNQPVPANSFGNIVIKVFLGIVLRSNFRCN